MKKIIYFLICFLGPYAIYAEKLVEKHSTPASQVVCYASGKVERTFIPPPEEVVNRLKSGGSKKSDIIVTYSLFPADAKAAFEYAVSIWENIIESPVPLYMQANWRSKNENVLGSCGSNHFYKNFKYAPHINRFYPGTVAEKITGKEITGEAEPDMTAEFNKSIKWYFGTDGKTPDSLYDFVSVVLHEIGHGLGLTGFFSVSGDVGIYAYENPGEASAYDLLVVNRQSQYLLDTLWYKFSSAKLKTALISNDLYAKSPVAIANGDGSMPRLYVPSTWDGGSSIYHLNDATYPAGSPNSLMTHAIGKGEAIHDPGPMAKGILDDIGWKSTYIDFTPVKDAETISPVEFSCTIRGDYPTDENNLFVFISTDGFKTISDSVKLVKTSVSNQYACTYNPQKTGSFSYYLRVKDSMKRIFCLPTEAPLSTYKFIIGQDKTPPVAEHTPIVYYLNNYQELRVNALVTDNIAVDTVYVEYLLNGVSQPSFGLKKGADDNFSGSFNFNPRLLKDADVIKYRIISVDKSSLKNTSRFPGKDYLEFKIEEIYAPVKGYINDFNLPTTDFITNEFKIGTEAGFNNPALNSPHPYKSPNENNSSLNFSTILKRPVILVANATMSFDEVVLVEPGESGVAFGSESFYDYVIVEASKDKGLTWKPIADGYDSGFNPTWLTNYNLKIVNQISQAVGKKDWFVTHNFNPLKNGNFSVGDTLLFRFRLFSDPYANGWGWIIDNLRIQFPVSAKIIDDNSANVSVYPNPVDDILNINIRNESGIENAEIEIFSMVGKKIFYKQTGKTGSIGLQQIQLGSYPSGVYLLTIRKEGKIIFSDKIIRK